MNAPTTPATLDTLAKNYGDAIGDILPTDTHFVLLVFRPGNDAEVKSRHAGIAYVTSAEAEEAVRVTRAFVAMVDAAKG